VKTVPPERVRLDLIVPDVGHWLRGSSLLQPEETQFISTISRSPSAVWRTTGATCRGKMAFTGSNAAVLLCETRKKALMTFCLGVSE
jgi:hypothetical protein